MMWAMKRVTALVVVALLTACPAGTGLTVTNTQADTVTVYVSFGSDSKVVTEDWPFCSGDHLSCSFDLPGNTTKSMPNPSGKYVNATFAFGNPVGCGSTKAEVNLNNPNWYDISDVSLVDGYSNKIQVDILADAQKDSAQTLGPPAGQTGNEKVFGLYPYGCDICVDRQAPPCGIPTGKSGCKDGTQYDPDVPCQWQGTTKGGGGHVIDVKYMGN